VATLSDRMPVPTVPLPKRRRSCAARTSHRSHFAVDEVAHLSNQISLHDSAGDDMGDDNRRP
jgi:hypothetical protein